MSRRGTERLISPSIPCIVSVCNYLNLVHKSYRKRERRKVGGKSTGSRWAEWQRDRARAPSWQWKGKRTGAGFHKYRKAGTVGKAVQSSALQTT